VIPYSESRLIVRDEGNLLNQQKDERGYFPDKRPIDLHMQLGVLNLDKPAGPTSHDVVSMVKKILDIKKAGHSGTLDPQVTGILPIALSSGTKVLQTLLQLPKTYICNMQVQNTEIEVVWKSFLQGFVGEIYQFPPLESNVVRKLRKRNIYEIQHLDELDNQVLFRVRCESGTYIRTLCDDLGRASGAGAFMKELRRIQTATFEEDDRVTLHQLFDAWMDFKEMGKEEGLRKVVLPIERMVIHLKEIIVHNDAIRSVCHGTTLGAQGVLAYTDGITKGEIIAAKSPKGELIGIGEALEDEMTEGNVFKVHKVIMDRNLYQQASTLN